MFCLFLGFYTAKAQSTANVTLNVILHPVQSIVVSAGGSIVNLVYDDTTKYNSGVTLAMADHLTVYSSGGFQVSVSVPTTTLGNGITTGVGTGQTIAASGITVQAAKGSTTNTGGSYGTTAIALSNTAQTLFSSTIGGAANKYNVTYKGAGNNVYVGKDFAAGTAATTYTTQVTYTIAAN